MEGKNNYQDTDESALVVPLHVKVNDSTVYLFLKRVMDIVGSGLGLIMLSPLFIVVAILIKLEDPKGNIFFSQVRNGKDGNTFKMYKFRSMVHNAEELLDELQDMNEQSGPVF